VAKMGLSHRHTARPLFHVWNLILKEIELGNWRRFWDHIPAFTYNGRTVALTASGSKGWQVSIFQDEIQGRYNFSVSTTLSEKERAFLERKYGRLKPDEMADLEKRLTKIGFSEMAPYYIMRYGFYEGHTGYRADPIAIAFVFGLRSLQELEAAFPGRLYEALSDHHLSQGL